jgi:hypothetical protein
MDPKAETKKGQVQWRDPRQALKNEATIRDAFTTLHRYLQNMVRNDRNSIKDPETLQGVHSLMLLANEAVQKLDRYAVMSVSEQKYLELSKCKEFLDLKKYYRQHILDQKPPPHEEEEDWEEELEGESEEESRLKDLEAVRQDTHYELFFIQNEEGKAFFSSKLLRHIRLVGHFDELVTKVEGEEDPLLRVRALYDRELYEGAKEALNQAAPFLDPFYKEAMRHMGRPFVANLNKTVMALRMAANLKNLIENASFKSCLEYYSDFHRFLRASLQSPGYKKLIAGEEVDPFLHNVLRLSHALCAQFFLRQEPKKEALVHIEEMEERGRKLRMVAATKKKGVLEELEEFDQNLRTLFAHHPSGPLLLTLDALREAEGREGFDPLLQSHFPLQLFNFARKDKHLTILRLPCPTKQYGMDKAEIVEEFLGFLRYLSHDIKPDKHLMINVQERHSWREKARCKELEELDRRADFYDTFYLMGLEIDTPFYSQSEEFASMSGAPVFFEKFQEQLAKTEESGYYFSKDFSSEKILSFAKEALPFLHKEFFQGKTTLTQEERCACIDLFYILLTLKAIEVIEPDTMSFTCKDGIDTSMAYTAQFYTFLRLMSDSAPLGAKEKEELLWILYLPALFIRDRAINAARFDRALHGLRHMNGAFSQNRKGIEKGLSHLLKK